MRRLVCESGVVALGVPEGFEGRQDDAVGGGAVEGAVAAVGKTGSRCLEEAFRSFDAGNRVEAGGCELSVLCRKAVDLFDVEDRVALEEVDFVGGFVAAGGVGLAARNSQLTP